MTLNGHYALCHSVSKHMRLSEPTTKIWMKIDPYNLQWRCSPITVILVNVRFIRTFVMVPWRGGVKRQCSNGKRRFSQGFWTLRLRHLGKWGQHYHVLLFSPLSAFQWPQNIWPWMTLMGYLVSNFVFAPVWLAETARLRKVIAWKLIKIDTYLTSLYGWPSADGKTTSVCNQLLRSTQSGHPFVSRRNEYQRKQGNKRAHRAIH